MKINKSLAENEIKNEIEQLLSKLLMITKYSKTNEPHKFVLNLSQRLNSRSWKKHVALQNLWICYTWLNIRKQYKNNKLKLVVPMWNNEFEFPDGSYSVSDVQDYIEYIIEKHKKITKVPPASVYSNRINNKLVFEIKDAFNLELQTSEEMNPFVRTKKLIEKKNKENIQVLQYQKAKSWSDWSSSSPT